MGWFLESEESLSNSLKQFNFRDDETVAQKLAGSRMRMGVHILVHPSILPRQSESSQSLGYLQQNKGLSCKSPPYIWAKHTGKNNWEIQTWS